MHSLPEILNIFFQRCQEQIIPASFTFKWDNEKIVKEYEKNGLFKSILKRSNIKNEQISSAFSFFSSAMQTNRSFFIFGTDHGPCDFGVNKKTGQVALLEIITGDFFFNVAKDEISFLRALTKMLEFDSHYRKKIHVTGEITRRIRQECINLAGGEEYAKFYKFNVISAEDSPSEPFTLP